MLTILKTEISLTIQLEQNEVNKALNKLLWLQAIQTQTRSFSRRQISVAFSIFLLTTVLAGKSLKLYGMTETNLFRL